MGWFQSLVLWVQGWLGGKGSKNARSVNVQRAAYDNAIKGTETRYKELSEAVSALMRLEEDDNEELGKVTTKIKTLNEVKQGALAKGKKVAAALKSQGKNKEEIEADGEYIKCITAYKDAEEKLTDAMDRQKEYTDRLAESKATLNAHKAELAGMSRDKASLEREKNEAIADIQVAERRKAVQQLLSGVSQTRTDDNLSAAREARKQVRAEAKLATELAGTSAAAQESEFLQEARTAAAADAFSNLIGLDDEAEKADHARLPE